MNDRNTKERNPATQIISLYRIKETVTLDVEKLKRKGFIEKYKKDNVTILLLPDRASTPKWSSHLKDAYGIPEIKNVSNSFILLYQENKNLYAACGGYAYKYIKDDYEEDFGLELAIRLISDTDNISAFHQRALNGTIKQLYQAVKGYNPNFDTENYNRMLRFIEGKSKFEGRKYKVSGRSALVLRTERGLGSIGELIQDIEKQLKKPANINFPKTFKQVNDDIILQSLEDIFSSEALSFLNDTTKDTNISLELEEFIKQASCEEFKVNLNGKSVHLLELDFDELKEKLPAITNLKSLTKNDLEKINFSAKSLTDEPILSRDPLTKISVFETTLSNVNYLKLNGKWFQILGEFQDYIDSEIKEITVQKNILPEWDNKKYPEEKHYNQYVASLKNFLMTDAKFIYLKGGYNKIELCDIYDDNSKTFYHIKKAWGSKSSYFFSQATVSIETFKNSALFRKNIRNKWPNQFPSTLKLDQCTVVIGMAVEESKHADFPLNIPYFSKLCLINAIGKISQSKVKVVLTPIKLIPKP